MEGVIPIDKAGVARHNMKSTNHDYIPLYLYPFSEMTYYAFVLVKVNICKCTQLYDYIFKIKNFLFELEKQSKSIY